MRCHVSQASDIADFLLLRFDLRAPPLFPGCNPEGNLSSKYDRSSRSGGRDDQPSSWSVKISSQSSCKASAPHLEASISSGDRFEVEISQIHVALRQYVYGENVLAFAERNLEKLRSQVPVVPLTPGQRICRVIRCRDLQSSRPALSVHIDCNG